MEVVPVGSADPNMLDQIPDPAAEPGETQVSSSSAIEAFQIDSSFGRSNLWSEFFAENVFWIIYGLAPANHYSGVLRPVNNYELKH